MDTIRILYLDNKQDDIDLLQLILKKSVISYELITVRTQGEYEAALSNSIISLIISEYNLPKYTGLNALMLAKEKRPELPFILISNAINEKQVMDMYQHGMTDFVNKNNLARLLPVIQSSVKELAIKAHHKTAEIALQSSEALLRQLTEHMQDLCLIVTPDLKQVIFVSLAYETIYGRSCASLYKHANDWLDAITSEDKPRVISLLSTLTQNNFPSVDIDYKIRHKMGGVRHLSSRFAQTKDVTNTHPHIISLTSDKTELVLTQKQNQIQSKIERNFHPQHSNLTLCEFLDCVCETYEWDLGTLWVVDKDKHTIHWGCSWSLTKGRAQPQPPTNKKNLKLTMELLQEVFSDKTPLWLSPSSEKKFPYSKHKLHHELCTTLLLPILSHDDVFGILELHSRQKQDCDPLLQTLLMHLCDWFGAFIYRKTIEHQLVHSTKHDLLTGLKNRSHFENRLEMTLNLHPKLLAIVVIDIDHFTEVNRYYGNDVGNRILQKVAEYLLLLRAPGVYIARYGADEFILSIEGYNVQRVVELIKKVMVFFKLAFRDQGQEVFLTASAGVSIYPKDRTKGEDLIKVAELAVKAAKKLGGNCFQLYSDDLLSNSSAHIDLINGLHYALEKKEFVLHYQPIIDVKTQQIVSVEALIRWEHPQRGLLTPAVFLALANEFGFTATIGEHVIEIACNTLKSWQEKNMALPIKVNVSPNQFYSHGFMDFLKKTIDDTGIDTSFLALEMVETSFIDGSISSNETIEKLNKLGIKISIDDFGTGYSSLNYLKKFQIDRLKIDKSFIDGIPDKQDDIAIVNTIILMAKGLGIKTTAEGVETLAQYNFLSQHGCDEVQGYYFYRPMAQEELEKILKKKLIR